MKSMVSPVTFPKRLLVGPFLRRRLDHTINFTCFNLMRGKDKLPYMNPLLRAISSVMVQVLSPSDLAKEGNDIAQVAWKKGAPSSQIRTVVQTYTAIARALDALALQQRMKMVQALMERDAMVNIMLKGAGLEGLPNGVTAEGIVDMCLNNRGAGPYDSEIHVVRLTNKMIGLGARAAEALPSAMADEETRISMLSEICTYIRLLELVNRQINDGDRNVPESTTMTPDDMITTTVKNLRTAAASLASVLLAARVTMMQHLMTVLSNPWFSGALTGHTSQQYHQALEEVQRRQYPLSGWTDWRELNEAGILDLDMSGLHWAIPERTDTLNPATVSDYVLYTDITTDVRISEVDPMRLLENVWLALTAADKDARLLHDAQSAGIGIDTISGVTVDLSNPTEQALDELSTISQSSGWPSVSRWDPINPCMPTDKILASSGLSRWEYYTTAKISGFSRLQLDAFPVKVKCSTPARGIPMYRCLEPVFKPWDQLMPYLPPSLDSLAKIWEVDSGELSRSLSLMLGQARPAFMRAIAEALRFVGIVIQKTGDSELPIIPMVGHYYHAMPVTLLRNMETLRPFHSDIVLAKAIEKKADQPGVHMELILRPFNRLPMTADIGTIGRHLAELPPRTTRPTASIIRWIQDDRMAPAYTQKLTVVGWRVAEADLADLIFMQLQKQHEGAEAYYSLYGHDDYAPVIGRQGNSVVSLLADGDPLPYTPAFTAPDPLNVELELDTK